jgi:hypothetical protein
MTSLPYVIIATLCIPLGACKMSCDPPVVIGQLTTIERGVAGHMEPATLINVDDGRQFVVYGTIDATPGRDVIHFKSGDGCAGAFVSFGDKPYWYQILH